MSVGGQWRDFAARGQISRRAGCRHRLERLPLGGRGGEYPRLFHVDPCGRILAPEARVGRPPLFRALIALRPIGRDTHGNQVHQRLTGDQLPVDDASHHRGRTFDDPSVQPR